MFYTLSEEIFLFLGFFFDSIAQEAKVKHSIEYKYILGDSAYSNGYRKN